MKAMQMLLLLIVIIAVLAIVGYYALKSYVVPRVVNQYTNSSQVQGAVNSLQVYQYNDTNPFANTSSEIPAQP